MVKHLRPPAELHSASSQDQDLLRPGFVLDFAAEAEGTTTDHILDQVLRQVPKMAETVNV